MFKRILNRGFSTIATIFIIIGVIILMAALSFVWFSFGYWLITLILPYFFAIFIPFSWSYALGGWLVALILGSFITPMLKFNVNYN